MKAIKGLLRHIDAVQQNVPPLAFVIGVVKKFGDDQAGYLAALISYYAFFSLFPLLLVMVTILGFVLRGHPALLGQVEQTVRTRVPVIDPNQIHSLHGSAIAFAIGLVLTLVAGIGVIQALQHAMDEVWGVPPRGRPNFIASRLKALTMLAVLGVATLAATAVSGIGGLGPAFVIIGEAGSVVLNIVIVAVAFKVLTSAQLSWGDVLPGAAVAGVALTILQTAGSLYVAHQLKHASQTYGTFAVVIGLLSWLFLGAQITIYAAEINAVRVRHLWPRSLTGAAPAVPVPEGQPPTTVGA